MFFVRIIELLNHQYLLKILERREKNENFIAVYPQNNPYLSCYNSLTSKNCAKGSATPSKMATRALDKKYFKKSELLVQIGNNF